MGLLTGATSLVELILKKYGDDVAGATQELVRLGGFPEPVARRIATGELPMDEASRLARAKEQGYGPTYYHGSKGDPIYEIDPEMSGRTNSDARGTGTWMSSSPDVAGTYTGSLGEGGVIYPMRSKAQDTAHVDYEGLNWNYLDPMSPVTMRDPNMKMSEGHFQGLEFDESMPEGEWYTFPAQDYDDALWDTNSIAHEAADRWHDSVLMENVVDHGGQDSFHVDIARLHPELNSMPYGSKQRHEYMRDRVSFEDKQKATEMYEARTQSPADNFVSFNPEDVRSANAAFDPEYTGSNIMGGLALPVTAGLLAAGQSEDADAGFVTRGGKTLLEAWHGSPHKFDKFSMDQIGTGEGAQAYGHGLYFADSEQVARQYRDELSRTVNYDGKPLVQGNRPNSSLTTTGDETVDDHIIASQGDIDAAIMQLEYDLRNYAPNDPNIPYDQDALKKLKQIKQDGLITIDDSAGHLYRAEIDVTPESLLDWDKPLSEQSEAVQEVLGPYRSDFSPTTGGALNLATDALGKGVPEKMLSERGIKGIKYLDGDSRAVGDGTSNYVIFDDSLINIAERGNATVPMLATTAGLSGAGLLAPQIKDSGFISSPRSEGLFNFTMGARDLERRLEGSPASLLFPSGLVEYLETVNRRTEDPNAMTRGMALLDVWPL